MTERAVTVLFFESKALACQVVANRQMRQPKRAIQTRNQPWRTEQIPRCRNEKQKHFQRQRLRLPWKIMKNHEKSWNCVAILSEISEKHSLGKSLNCHPGAWDTLHRVSACDASCAVQRSRPESLRGTPTHLGPDFRTDDRWWQTSRTPLWCHEGIGLSDFSWLQRLQTRLACKQHLVLRPVRKRWLSYKLTEAQQTRHMPFASMPCQQLQRASEQTDIVKEPVLP